MPKALLKLNDQYTFSFPATVGIQYKRFFQATVPARTLVNILQLDNKGSTLERSQREVNRKRAAKFAQYLLKNLKKKSFFIIPSLVGYIETPVNSPEPRFFDSYEVMNIKRDEVIASAGSLGLLVIHMDSTVKLFDGQHRGSGIAEGFTLIRMYPEEFEGVNLDAISVPLMLYSDLTLEERQLGFTDINMNLAKPSASISLSYDKRDNVAKLAVEVATTLPCFKGVVDLERNVVSGKSEYIFPLKSIYDSIRIILDLKPSQKEIEITAEQQEKVKEIFNTMSRIMGWSGLGFTEQSGEHLRDRHIFTHAIVLKAVAMAGAAIDATFSGIENADLEGIKSLDFGRHSPDFEERCICKKSGNMITNVTAATLTANKILLSVGCPLNDKAAELERKYFGDFEQPVLPVPTPAPEPEDDRILLEDTVDLKEIITLDAAKQILMASPVLEDMSEEQIEEAADKLIVVLGEKTGTTGAYDDNVYPVLTNYAIEQYKEHINNEENANQLMKALLNIRTLRALIGSLLEPMTKTHRTAS